MPLAWSSCAHQHTPVPGGHTEQFCLPRGSHISLFLSQSLSHTQKGGLLLHWVQNPRNMPHPLLLGLQRRPSVACVGWGVAKGA